MRLSILQILLFPFSLILTCVVGVRNWLYDKQLLESTKPGVFTINVGNLNLGGTGKTPHVEYLVNLLTDKYRLSILSRGYKRETKGFVFADDKATAKTIGDEPMQYYLKFRDRIRVVVCEDRVSGVGKIQSQWPDNELIILDDAFQHRKITPHLNLLLCDFNRPFYEDFMVPTGHLRDIRHSAQRADVVIVTKCPEQLAEQERGALKEGIANYTKLKTPVFFSHIQYKAVASYMNGREFRSKDPITLVTAIAKPEVFVQYFKNQGIVIENSFEYPDHFDFSRKGITDFFDSVNPSQQIVTTEKDMVKLKPLLNAQELERFFYQPIEVVISDVEEFNRLILTSISGATL